MLQGMRVLSDSITKVLHEKKNFNDTLKKKSQRKNFHRFAQQKKIRGKIFTDSLDSKKSQRKNFSPTHSTQKNLRGKIFHRLTRLKKISEEKFFTDSLD